jgi:hypothetical protein
VDVKRLRSLEAENAWLVLAEKVMGIEILKDVAAKNDERVHAPAKLTELNIDTSSYRPGTAMAERNQ